MRRLIASALAALFVLQGIPPASAASADAAEKRIDRLERENERLRDKLDRLQDRQDEAIRQAVQDRAAVQEKLFQEASKNVDKQGETINKLVNYLQLGLVFASLAIAALTFIGLRAVKKWLQKRIDKLVTSDLVRDLVHRRGEEAIKDFEQQARTRLAAVEQELETLKRLPRSAAEPATPEQAAALREVSQQAEAKAEGKRSYSDWFALGLEHYQAGQWEEARQAWESVLKLRSSDSAALGNLALVAERQERFDEADGLYKRALEADPKNAHLGNYAIFLRGRGRFDEAETYYRRALEVASENANNLGNYANFLGDRDRLDEAETYYKRAIEVEPKHARNLGNYAIFLRRRGRPDEAEAYFKRALEADPKHANNLGNYAILLEQRERFEEAETVYKRMLDADPRNTGRLGSYAIFLKGRGRFDEAEAHYKRALEAVPRDANSLGNYAQVLFERGRLDEATERLRAALAGDGLKASLLAELHYYRYAHLAEERDDALKQLKGLVRDGARSKDWDFSGNIVRAKADGHPDPELLAKLAAVIAGKAPAADLDNFPAWRSA